jgi:hypothetical protein
MTSTFQYKGHSVRINQGDTIDDEDVTLPREFPAFDCVEEETQKRMVFIGAHNNISAYIEIRRDRGELSGSSHDFAGQRGIVTRDYH